MSRIRTIKPDFFLDTELAELPIAARLFFVGLWTQADREGRLEDNAKRLKAQLLPWDDVDAEQLLTALCPRFVTRYEAAGRRFLQINTFAEHQRPNIREAASAIPPPLIEALPQQCPSTAPTATYTLDKGKGKEGNGERSKEVEGFTDFWTAYPKRVSKQDALRSWVRLKPTAELQALIVADVKRRAASAEWRKEDGKFIPYPATYINGRRWEDQGVQLPTVRPGPDAATAAHLAARAIA